MFLRKSEIRVKNKSCQQKADTSDDSLTNKTSKLKHLDQVQGLAALTVCPN